MKPSVLVTGGLGFIGSHLSRRLLFSGTVDHLTIVDNLSSTRVDYSDLVGKADIVIDDMRKLGSGRRFDVIYHLASPVGSLGILARSGRIAGDIIGLAETAADMAEACDARLVYVSSSEVYGRDGAHHEDVAQVVPARRGPRMEYALGKLTAEHLLLNRSVARGLDVRVVRPFNAMGEWQSGELGFVVPRFFEAALRNTPIPVHGDGRQRRAFCHVEDIVAGIVAVEERGLPAHVYNVGNAENEIAIEDLAAMIRDLCNSNSTLRHVDPAALYGSEYIEAFDKIPDTRKITAHTGWAPRVDLAGALSRVQEHYGRRFHPGDQRLAPSRA